MKRNVWKWSFAIVVSAAAVAGCRERREDTRAPLPPPAPAETEPAPVAQQQPAEPSPPEPLPEAQAQPVDRAMLFTIDETELVTLADRPLVVHEPVIVSRVISNKVFLIRDGQGTNRRELVVVRDDMATPGMAAEGTSDLVVGDTLIHIEGHVRRVDPAQLQQWGLEETDQRDVAQRPVYIHAMKIEKKGAEPQARANM